jgi:hypothetical protein
MRSGREWHEDKQRVIKHAACLEAFPAFFEPDYGYVGESKMPLRANICARTQYSSLYLIGGLVDFHGGEQGLRTVT